MSAGATPTGGDFVEHSRIAPSTVARRDYQVAIAHEALQRDTLVILPTGMGKTVVGLLVLAERLEAVPGKVLFLAPTKPLVEQHAAFLRETLRGARVAVFTGETPPEERELAWREADVVCSTPQVVQNDVVADRLDLRAVTLLLVDEAHRAVGNYAYVFLAEAYRRQRMDARVLALTASPGADAEKIRQICQNLGIVGLELRTEHDPDTAPYVQETNVEWKVVAVPESLQRAARLLREQYEQAVQQLAAAGGLPPHVRKVGKKALLDAQRSLSARLRGGEQDPQLYKALSVQAAALKLNHAVELIETQGVQPLSSYYERLRGDASKAAKAILADPRTDEIQRLLATSRTEHPKLRQVAILLRQQLKEKPDSRIIVFTNYRDTGETLVEALKDVEGVRAARFVGQASRGETDKGLTQKQQVERVRQFKEGTYNVLVATSVAEEGLDIPATDLVVFYEPVPSEIRTIQRRGRTGRRRAGRVVILITKDTRDETYHWAARGKETRMRRELDVLRRHFAKVNASEENDAWRKTFPPLAGRPGTERRLDSFETLQPPTAPSSPKLVIVADHREFNSAVVRELSKLGVAVRPETLEVGDYLLSDRLAVERKEAADLASSLVDGRLFAQVRALRDAYTSPLLVVEGDGLYTARRLSEAALDGAIAAIVADLRVSLLTTKDAGDTARLLVALARREQVEERRPLAMRGAKAAMTEDERLRYLVEGLPRVSAVLARRLLERFGTVKAIADATVAELMEVEGVGTAIATDVHRVLRTQYVGHGGKT